MLARIACVWCLTVWLLAAFGCSTDSAPPNQAVTTPDASVASVPRGGTPAAPMAEVASTAAPRREDPARSCCEVQTQPGCAQANVQQCVCDRVASCCQSAWDVVCVQLIDALGCASCKAPCCEIGVTAGCQDATIESCVCAADPSCCTGIWDDYCTVLVDSLKCGTCK